MSQVCEPVTCGATSEPALDGSEMLLLMYQLHKIYHNANIQEFFFLGAECVCCRTFHHICPAEGPDGG